MQLKEQCLCTSFRKAYFATFPIWIPWWVDPAAHPSLALSYGEDGGICVAGLEGAVAPSEKVAVDPYGLKVKGSSMNTHRA